MVIFCRFAVAVAAMLAVSIAIADSGYRADDAEAIKKSFQKMSESASEGLWKQAAELMTAPASEEVSAQVLIMCAAIRDADFPMSDERLEEAQDEIDGILRDFQLGDIDLPMTMFRFGGPADEEEQKELQKQAEKNLAIAKEALTKVEDRWALVAKLQAATKGLPFGHNALLSGKIVEVEVAEESAQVTIKPQPPEQDDESGARVQIIAPPRVVNYQKVDDQWLYAGINREKTDAAIREFQKQMADGPRDADF